MLSIKFILRELINPAISTIILNQNTKLRIQNCGSFFHVSFEPSMNKPKNIIAAKQEVIPKDDDSTESKDQNRISLEKEAQNKIRKINLKILKRRKNTPLDVTEDIKRNKSFADNEVYEKDGDEIDKFSSNVYSVKGKLRAVVDLKMMKEELKQLEDPPITPWENEICAARLPFSFFDKPCKDLAQNLLGKILVRRLENGTILKGRIVETEGYLGGIDKASHSYGNKITSRNIPMYMSPGTIYVYMTYGMYHCFNISSQEAESFVLIKTLEPLLGLEYMELLRNMEVQENGKEKKIAKSVKRFKSTDLCDNPSNICTAFFINEELHKKNLCDNNDLWVESDPYSKFVTIVAVPYQQNDLQINSMNEQFNTNKICRYYVLGSSSIKERISSYEEHAYTL